MVEKNTNTPVAQANPDPPVYDVSKIVQYMRSKLDAAGSSYNEELLYKAASNENFKNFFVDWHYNYGLGGQIPNKKDTEVLFESWILPETSEKKNPNPSTYPYFVNNPNVVSALPSISGDSKSSSDSDGVLSLEEEFGGGVSQQNIPAQEEADGSKDPKQTDYQGIPLSKYDYQEYIPLVSPIGNSVQINQPKYLSDVIAGLDRNIFKSDDDTAEERLKMELGPLGYKVYQDEFNRDALKNTIYVTRPDGQTRPFRLMTDSYRSAMIGQGQSEAAADVRIGSNINEFTQWLSMADEQGSYETGSSVIDNMSRSLSASPNIYTTTYQLTGTQSAINHEEATRLAAFYNQGADMFRDESGVFNSNKALAAITGARKRIAGQLIRDEVSDEQPERATQVRIGADGELEEYTPYAPSTPPFVLKGSKEKTLKEALDEQKIKDDQKTQAQQAELFLATLEQQLLNKREKASKMLGGALGLSGKYKDVDYSKESLEALSNSGLRIFDLPTDAIKINGNASSVSTLYDVIMDPSGIESVRSGRVKIEVTDHPEAYGFYEPFITGAKGVMDRNKAYSVVDDPDPESLLDTFILPKLYGAWEGDKNLAQNLIVSLADIWNNIGNGLANIYQGLGFSKEFTDEYLFGNLGIFPQRKTIESFEEDYLPLYNTDLMDAGSFSEAMTLATPDVVNSLPYFGAFMVNPAFGLAVTGTSTYGAKVQEIDDLKLAAQTQLDSNLPLTSTQIAALDITDTQARLIALSSAGNEMAITRLFTYNWFKNLGAVKNFKGAKTAENAKIIANNYAKSTDKSVYARIGKLFGVDPKLIVNELPEEMIIAANEYAINVHWGLTEYDPEVFSDMMYKTGLITMMSSAGMAKLAKIGDSKRAKQTADALIVSNMNSEFEQKLYRSKHYYDLGLETAEQNYGKDSDEYKMILKQRNDINAEIVDFHDRKMKHVSQFSQEDRTLFLDAIIQMKEADEKVRFHQAHNSAGQYVSKTVARQAKDKIAKAQDLINKILAKYPSDTSLAYADKKTYDKYMDRGIQAYLISQDIDKVDEEAIGLIKMALVDPESAENRMALEEFFGPGLVFSEESEIDINVLASNMYAEDLENGETSLGNNYKPTNRYGWTAPEAFVPDVSYYKTEKFNLDYELKRFLYEGPYLDEKTAPGDAYHGTTATFTQFDPGFLGTNTNALSSEEGFFFTSSPELAGKYAQFGVYADVFSEMEYYDYAELSEIMPNERTENQQGRYEYLSNKLKEHQSKSGTVMRVGLDIKNPYEYDANFNELSELQKVEVIDRARNLGFDGVVFKNLRDDPTRERQASDVYVAFDSKQIIDLSATGEVPGYTTKAERIREILINLSQLNATEDFYANLPDTQKKVITKFFEAISTPKKDQTKNEHFGQVEAIIKSAQTAAQMQLDAPGQIELFPTGDPMTPGSLPSMVGKGYNNMVAFGQRNFLYGRRLAFGTTDAFLTQAFRNKNVKKHFDALWSPIIQSDAKITTEVNRLYKEQINTFESSVKAYNKANGTSYSPNINHATNSYEQYMLAMAYRRVGGKKVLDRTTRKTVDAEFARTKSLLKQAVQRAGEVARDGNEDDKKRYELLATTYARLGFDNASDFADVAKNAGKWNVDFVQNLAAMQDSDAAIKRIVEYGGIMPDNGRNDGTRNPFEAGTYIPIPFVKSDGSISQGTRQNSSLTQSSNPDAASLNIITFPNQLSDDLNINPGMFAKNAFGMYGGARFDIETRDNMTALMYMLDHPGFKNLWKNNEDYKLFRDFFHGKKQEYDNIVTAGSDSYVDIGKTNGAQNAWKATFNKAADAYYSWTAALGLARPEQRASQFYSAGANVFSRLNSTAASNHLSGHMMKFGVGLSTASNGRAAKTQLGKIIQNSFLGSGDLSNIHNLSRTNLRNSLKADLQLDDNSSVPSSYYFDYMGVPLEGRVAGEFQKYLLQTGQTSPGVPVANVRLGIDRFLEFLSAGNNLSLEVWLSSTDRAAATASFEALYIDARVAQGQDLSNVDMKEWWARENKNPNLEAIKHADEVISQTMRQTGNLSEAPIYLRKGGVKIALQTLLPFGRFQQNAKAMWSTYHSIIIDPTTSEQEKQEARAAQRGIGMEVFTFQAIKHAAQLMIGKGLWTAFSFGLEDEDIDRYGGYSQMLGTQLPIEDREGVLEEIMSNSEREQRYQDFKSGALFKDKVTKEGEALSFAQNMNPNIDDAAYFVQRWSMEYEEKFDPVKTYPIIETALQDIALTALPFTMPDQASDFAFMMLNEHVFGKEVFQEFLSDDLEQAKTKGGWLNLASASLGMYGIGLEQANRFKEAVDLFYENKVLTYSGEYGTQTTYIGPGGPNQERIEKLNNSVEALMYYRALNMSPFIGGAPKAELNKYLNYLQRSIENEFKSRYTEVDPETGETISAPDPMMPTGREFFDPGAVNWEKVDEYRKEYLMRTQPDKYRREVIIPEQQQN